MRCHPWLDPGGLEPAVLDFELVHGRLVADFHAQLFGAAEIGIHQRLAAAHEEGIGARHMQRARQRRLEVHAMPAHPVAAGRGGADHHARQMLVGDAARDLEQVLPVLFFGIGLDQHVLGRVVHAAQIAGVAGVAAAPFARCGFKQQHAAAGFARHQRGAQGGIATTDDEYIGVKGFSFHDGLPRAVPAAVQRGWMSSVISAAGARLTGSDWS
jgi:hypothetical protein